MAITTPSEIIAVKSPSYATDPRLADLIDLAKFYVVESVFGDAYNLALALFVCHGLALEAMGGGSSTQSGSGASGGVSKVKEGQVEKTFGSVSLASDGAQSYYNQTVYGQELWLLYRSNIIGFMNRTI